MAEELTLVRRVDRHLDCTEFDRGEEAEHLLWRVLQQRRDPIALSYSEPNEGPCQSIGLVIHAASRVHQSFEIQIWALRIVRDPSSQRCHHGHRSIGHPVIVPAGRHAALGSTSIPLPPRIWHRHAAADKMSATTAPVADERTDDLP